MKLKELVKPITARKVRGIENAPSKKLSSFINFPRSTTYILKPISKRITKS